MTEDNEKESEVTQLRTFTNATSRDLYDGAELGKTSFRTGAYDFMEHQSLINGELRDYRGNQE